MHVHKTITSSYNSLAYPRLGRLASKWSASRSGDCGLPPDGGNGGRSLLPGPGGGGARVGGGGGPEYSFSLQI